MLIGTIFLVMAVILAALIPFLNKFAERKAKTKRYGNEENESGEQTIQVKTDSLQDLWEIKDIKNGIITMADGSLRTILSLGSLDYRLLSHAEQNAVETALMSCALIYNFPVQFVVVTENADMRGFISQINVGDNWPDEAKLYARNLASYLEDLTKSRTVPVRRSYLVISCRVETSIDNAYKEIMRRSQVVINNLARAHVVARVLESESVVNLLHNILNGSKLSKPSQLVRNGALDMIITGRGINVVGNTEKQARQAEQPQRKDTEDEHAEIARAVRAGHAG